MATTATIAPDRRKLSPDAKLGVETIAGAGGPSGIEKLYGDLVPAGLVDPDRQKFITGLAVGAYVTGLDHDGLQRRMERVRAEVARQRGQEDPKIDRLAALRFAREIRTEAVSRDPLEGLENADAARKYDAAVRYAGGPEMGWRPEDIRKATVDLIVKFDGDREKAAHAFYELVRGDRRVEAGHARNTGIEIDCEGGKSRQIPEIAVAPGADQAEALKERERRENRADRRLDETDKVAAAVLTDKEYAGYRLMRDNAHLVHLSRTEMTLDGDQQDNTPAKLISERLNVSRRASRQYVDSIIAKVRVGRPGIDNDDLHLLPGNGPKLTGRESVSEYLTKFVDYGTNIDRRLHTPTEKIVAAARNDQSPEKTNESRERERAQARARAARLYAAKKARQAAERDAGVGF